jgi:hypothetical protein
MKQLFGLLVALVSVSAFGQITSDELAPVSCGNRLVAGITCTGRYCDNIKAICGGPAHQIYQMKWMPFVSEEGNAVTTCALPAFFGKADPGTGFVTGFACKGSYCDNVSLQCVSLRDAYPDVNRCRWTGWISDETGTVLFPPDNGATKMECSGRYCDNMRFWLCPLRRP